MKLFFTILLLGTGLLLGTPSSQGAPMTFTALLDGPSENPPNASPGTGVAVVTHDPVAHTLSIDVSFSGLLGSTTAAHIHCCTDPPANVGVATQTPVFVGFPLGVTAGAYNNTFDTSLSSTFNASFVTNNGGVAGAEAALGAGLLAGRAYFNIHTNLFPGGEIRGFLTQIPEPGTLGLLTMGMTGLGMLARRPRR
jgi:hypothetical protein